MKCINLASVFLPLLGLIDLAVCNNEIGVVRASGDIAHSLLELLAGGRLNVDENQSHFTALRARLQDKPIPSKSNILNKIASNLDDIVQIGVAQTAKSEDPNDINFVEDTDERNFVTEPYPPKATRRWMINRMDPSRMTTTAAPPSTTQFTLFPTFPTLFPPLFGGFTPFQLPQLPALTTPVPIKPIFGIQTTSTTTVQPTTTTTKVTTTTTTAKEVTTTTLAQTIPTEETKQDLDLLKPPHSTTRIPHKSKIVGSKLEFKLGGEKSNKQQGGDDEDEDEPTTNRPRKFTERPDDEDEDTTTQPNNSSTDSPDDEDEDGSGSGKPRSDDGDSSGSGDLPSTCTDGKWSSWKEKIPCSEECGACGRLQRERECLSFKNGKGCPCNGDYKVIEPCNIEVCRFPKPSCCPPFDLIYVDGVFACGECLLV